MQTVKQILTEKFIQALNMAYPHIVDPTDLIEVTISTNLKFGHYQCNSAMRLTKKLGAQPREIAAKLIDNFDVSHDKFAEMVKELTIAGPGFINITLTDTFLEKYLKAMYQSGNLGLSNIGSGKKVIVDYSSPNIAKEMHVGHLRSTIIGDALANMFEVLGFDVLRLNHVGDWGTAFGMLIAYMLEHDLCGKDTLSLGELVNWYKLSKKEFDDNAEFKVQAKQQVVKLQAGDEATIEIWKRICDVSREAFSEIYTILGIEGLQERGESFYNRYLPKLVNNLLKQGIATHSAGAVCIFVDGFTNREGQPLPLIIRKEDGGYNYATTDMAALRHRVEEEEASRIIYVTDAGQAEHFNMVFSAARLAGFVGEVELNHVPFGLVLGSDKKKFKTRSGDTERLIDLLIEAKRRALLVIRGKGSELDLAEQQNLAEILGIGAVKYADLSGNRTQDYVFSYDKMLQFEGNTIVSLMYSYVRVAGIKRKVGVTEISSDSLKLSEPAEIELALHLEKFNQIILGIAKDLLPNRLADYLYELSGKFNAFFRDCRVEGVPEQDSRLVLCELTANTLKAGMQILGLKTVERM